MANDAPQAKTLEDRVSELERRVSQIEGARFAALHASDSTAEEALRRAKRADRRSKRD